MTEVRTIQPLFDIIADEPLPPMALNGEKQIVDTRCPFCDSKKIRSFGSETTLVGYFGIDGNHVWKRCECKSCKKNFTHEYKHLNEWYTHPDEQGRSHLIGGVPSCFEPYVYSCRCGGEVTRVYTNLDEGDLSSEGGLSVLVRTKEGPQYRTFWQCNTCDVKVETSLEYFPGYTDEGEIQISKPVKKPSNKKKLDAKWDVEIADGYVYAPYQPVYKPYNPDEEEE